MNKYTNKLAIGTGALIAAIPASTVAEDLGRSRALVIASVLGILSYLGVRTYNRSINHQNEAELAANPNSTDLKSTVPAKIQRGLGLTAIASPALVYGGRVAGTVANSALSVAVPTVLVVGGVALTAKTFAKSKTPNR